MSWEVGNQKPLNREDVNKQVLELEGYLEDNKAKYWLYKFCLLYTSPSPRDVEESRMPSSA